jgi:hypothetical protein
MVCADIEPANIVTHDDDNVRLARQWLVPLLAAALAQMTSNQRSTAPTPPTTSCHLTADRVVSILYYFV